MNWISVKDNLPKDESIFLSLWKGKICLTQFDKEENRFYIIFEPANYSQSWKIDQEREGKFTHWMPLPDLPE